MSDYYSSKDDKISFQQIIFGHYKRILELTCIEMRGGFYNYTYSGNQTFQTYVPDNRKIYSQAVIYFANALFPKFDKQMQKEYDLFVDKDKKLFEKYSTNGFIDNEEKRLMYSIERMDSVDELFRNLSCLLSRLDYLKTAVYEEKEDEE